MMNNRKKHRFLGQIRWFVTLDNPVSEYLQNLELSNYVAFSYFYSPQPVNDNNISPNS